MLLKSYRQESGFQKSSYFPACFENHLCSSTSKLIKIKSILEFLEAEKRFEEQKLKTFDFEKPQTKNHRKRSLRLKR